MKRYSITLNVLSLSIGVCTLFAAGAASQQVTRDFSGIQGIRPGSEVECQEQASSLICDVCVVGGGSGGIGAAIAAARAGADVILVEREPALGGTGTRGGVSIWASGPGCMIAREIYDRLAARTNGVVCSNYDRTLTRESGTTIPYNPDVFSEVAIAMLRETGRCRVLLNTCFVTVTFSPQLKRVDSIQAFSDDGTDYRIQAAVFIDCTGDGVLCQAAGCETMLGAEPKSRFNEPSAPVDPENILNAIEQIYRVRKSSAPVIQPLPEGVIPRWNEGEVSCCFDPIPGTDIRVINPCGLISGWTLMEKGYEATQVEARLQALAHWHVYQKQRPDYTFDSFAPMLAIRESYRILGEYVLTEQDVTTPLSESLHSDIIAFADHPMDTHGTGGGLRTAAAPYGIPYRCLVPKGDWVNLLIACRGASFSHIAASSCRLQRTMIQLGNAAGLAAAQSVAERCDVGQVNVAAIQKELGLTLPMFSHVRHLVVEDFEFYANGQLGCNAGGSGFKNSWTTNAVPVNVTNTINLQFDALGYEVTCLGTGLLTGSHNKGTLVRRAFAASIPGTSAGRTTWFTTLIRATSGGRIGWHFNAIGSERTSAIAGFLAVGNDFRKLVNGVLTTTGKVLSVNTTHLILGSVLLKDTGEATINYWIDPADLTSTNTLSLPDVTFNVAFTNSLGAALANVSVEGYHDVNCQMDALRISDGSGVPAQAFLDVTRATPKALFGPVQFGSLAEVTNNFILINAIATNDWMGINDGNYGAGGFLSSEGFPEWAHHVFVPDSDGAVGGASDIFGDCTIEYDIRTAGSAWNVGVFFLGASRSDKHWMLNVNNGSQTNDMRAYYNRPMDGVGGGSIQTTVTHPLDLSDWRHIRLDVRRINSFTQVDVRVRIWNKAGDFREEPELDTNITYDAANSIPEDGEIGFSVYSGTTASDIDNVAVYRYGGAPDWFIPKGCRILLNEGLTVNWELSTVKWTRRFL